MLLAKNRFHRAATLIALAVGLVLAGCQSSSQTEGPKDDQTDRGLSATQINSLLASDTMAPVIGAPEAPVKVHSFVRLTCSSCRDYVGHMRALIRTDRIQYVFHGVPNLPVEGGKGGKGGVEREWTMSALHCASQQNDFQAYHDRLFWVATRLQRNQNVDETLFRMAQQVGLDVDALHACITSGGGQPQIAAAQALADTLGVEKVPAIFVDGVRLTSPDQFPEVIRQSTARNSQEEGDTAHKP